jgi:glutamate-5-semialdehyde dehydrogenase
MTVKEKGKLAKIASRRLAVATTDEKNEALRLMSKALIDNTNAILKANAEDLENGKKAGLTTSLLDRLMLNEERIKGMADAIIEVSELNDPIGEVLENYKNKAGLDIKKVRVPIGVIGIIYEARPNVTSDAAALTLKTGNAVILRGGKEAINSNVAITNVLRDALSKSSLPVDSVSIIEDTSRDSANELMRLNDYLDLLIPRGSAGLIRAVVDNSKVPVIETGAGNCHIYVEKSADIEMSANVIFNAKTSRPSVCNAIETVLIDEDIAEKALPVIYDRLKEKNVEIRGCEKTCKILKDAIPATEDDYYKEFGDFILAVKVVSGIDEAIDHITKYGTGHSEGIMSKDQKQIDLFTSSIDAAAVYSNASTRFTDGGEFGLGAEIGISTQKIHARGPMGLRELCSTKYIITGNGQVR